MRQSINTATRADASTPRGTLGNAHAGRRHDTTDTFDDIILDYFLPRTSPSNQAILVCSCALLRVVAIQ